MSNAERVAKGLLIFMKYDPESDVYAEHDIIYAGPSRKNLGEISDVDAIELKKLGWHHDKEYDSWAKFV